MRAATACRGLRAATAWRALLLAAAVLLPGVWHAAHARADVIHAGVSLDAIVPAGLVHTRVRAPSAPGMPVRVVLASSPRGPAQFLVDVTILVSARAARTSYAHQVETRASRALPAMAGVGDAASGGGRFVVFVRDNVVVAVLATQQNVDVMQVARHIDAAVSAAPPGDTSAVSVTPSWDEAALTQRAATRLVLAADVVASDVVVGSGPARVRRLRDGWLLMRRAPGAFVLSVTIVDSQLRVSRR